MLLCAGVFQSPQILELSGIGSPKLLQSHGLELVVENTNVGENLQDHPLSGMWFEVVRWPSHHRYDPPTQPLSKAQWTPNNPPAQAHKHQATIPSPPSPSWNSSLKKETPNSPSSSTPTLPPLHHLKPHPKARNTPSSAPPSNALPTGSIILGTGTSQLHFNASLQIRHIRHHRSGKTTSPSSSPSRTPIPAAPSTSPPPRPWTHPMIEPPATSRTR